MTQNASQGISYVGQYHAFGLHDDKVGSIATDKHRANTKVEDEDYLLNEGKRFRHLEYGVFLTPDPLEYVDGPNPYIYCAQNPWGRWDPEGLAIDTFWDIGNIIYDAGAAIYNHIAGDHKTAKSHWVDAGYDTAAALVPGVPAGLSKIKNVGKALDKAKDVAKGAEKTSNKVKSSKEVAEQVNKEAKKKAPIANEGNSKPHGKKDHDDAINNRIKELRKENAENIRKNQKQVDKDGNIVGNNRPDVQYNKNGVHHNEEFDRNQKRSDEHIQRIKKNDPDSKNKGNII